MLCPLLGQSIWFYSPSPLHSAAKPEKSLSRKAQFAESFQADLGCPVLTSKYFAFAVEAGQVVQIIRRD
jgi:hypothetical protein